MAFSIIGSQIVFISILGLLKKSTWPNICADSLRRLLFQCFFLSIIYPARIDGFPFLSIYGQPYLTFLFPLILLLFDVPVVLLLEDGMCYLCILCHSCMGWNIYNSWLCCILLGVYEELSHS